MYFATRSKLFTLKLTLINGLFEPIAVLICALLFGWESPVVDSDKDFVSNTINTQFLAAGKVDFCYFL
jgi:hypothetical protein